MATRLSLSYCIPDDTSFPVTFYWPHRSTDQYPTVNGPRQMSNITSLRPSLNDPFLLTGPDPPSGKLNSSPEPPPPPPTDSAAQGGSRAVLDTEPSANRCLGSGSPPPPSPPPPSDSFMAAGGGGGGGGGGQKSVRAGPPPNGTARWPATRALLPASRSILRQFIIGVIENGL